MDTNMYYGDPEKINNYQECVKAINKLPEIKLSQSDFDEIAVLGNSVVQNFGELEGVVKKVVDKCAGRDSNETLEILIYFLRCLISSSHLLKTDPKTAFYSGFMLSELSYKCKAFRDIVQLILRSVSPCLNSVYVKNGGNDYKIVMGYLSDENELEYVERIEKIFRIYLCFMMSEAGNVESIFDVMMTSMYMVYDNKIKVGVNVDVFGVMLDAFFDMCYDRLKHLELMNSLIETFKDYFEVMKTVWGTEGNDKQKMLTRRLASILKKIEQNKVVNEKSLALEEEYKKYLETNNRQPRVWEKTIDIYGK
ncbi:hypothetical protein EIN_449520 [Entamoeba invadens IP1]|uniref:MIF4G domain-containing protein n=1 Tax=Entamoeba invadens IP1 TaxID=370355 RepID=L7FL60_ENTIV|nr:hypothetical protein EIN_449520 [Entamoeba invadens IP1]ELP86769.1 hypothetical protein EIN_449520 [Entamoeba invadens IP1]|eukprot:XP_004253540.1 hypothetical protein EIN_449520 [Entamoeba invadens IP1]